MREEPTYFQRSLFSDGMLLCAGDLENQQAYTDGKRRLLNRSFFGYGVVYGLKVSGSGQNLSIGEGFALDRQGREIFLPHPEPLCLSALFPEKKPDGLWFLCLEYEETPCGAGVMLPDPVPKQTVPNRIQERFSLSARRERGEKSLCVAVADIKEDAGQILVLSLRSPVDGFTPGTLFQSHDPPPPVPTKKSAWGTLLLDLRQVPCRDGVYYSHEICHGLGPGKVNVTLAVKDWQEGRRCLLSGDLTLWGINARLGVRLYPDTGSFTAAVRPKNGSRGRLWLSWRAERLDGGPGG